MILHEANNSLRIDARADISDDRAWVPSKQLPPNAANYARNKHYGRMGMAMRDKMQTTSEFFPQY